MGSKLSSEQFQQLHDLLISAYPTNDDFTLFVGLKLSDNADNIEPRSGLAVRFFVLMKRYELQIAKLIKAALDDPKHKDNLAFKKVLQTLLDELDKQNGLPASVSPFDVYFVPPGRPFINRTKFRHHLRDLHQDQGKRFLLVNGQPGSGKTYSQYLVQALATHFNFRYCFIELEQEIPSKYYPDDLARRIDRDLILPETEPLPLQQNVGERWAQELCDWLVEKIRKEDKRVWIILDGFSSPDLPDETKHLTHFLIEAIDKRLPQARLLLLDYDPNSLRRSLRPFVNIEHIQDIDNQELMKYFSTVFTHKGIEYDETQLQDIVTRILQDIPTDQYRLEEIMYRVIQMNEQLLSEE